MGSDDENCQERLDPYHFARSEISERRGKENVSYALPVTVEAVRDKVR